MILSKKLVLFVYRLMFVEVEIENWFQRIKIFGKSLTWKFPNVNIYAECRNFLLCVWMKKSCESNKYKSYTNAAAFGSKVSLPTIGHWTHDAHFYLLRGNLPSFCLRMTDGSLNRREKCWNNFFSREISQFAVSAKTKSSDKETVEFLAILQSELGIKCPSIGNQDPYKTTFSLWVIQLSPGLLIVNSTRSIFETKETFSLFPSSFCMTANMCVERNIQDCTSNDETLWLTR